MTQGPIGEAHVLVVPDLTRFAAELKAQLAAAIRAVKDPEIQIDPDLGSFTEKVKRETTRTERTTKAKVPVAPDLDGFREKVKEETTKTERTTKGKVPVAPDLSRFAPEVREFIARFDPKEQIKLAATLDRQSFAKTAAEVKALAKAAHPTVEVETKVDRNVFQRALAKAVTPDPELFETLKHTLAQTLSTPLGLAVAATLTTVIAGALPAAISLGLGAGLVGLAAFALRGSKILKTHFKAAGAVISESLRQAAQPLKGPFLQAIETLSGALLQLQPQFRSLFAGLAPSIKPFVDGIAGFVRELLPNLQAAMPAINAAFAEFGARLPGLGKTLGGVFAAISDNLPAIQKGIDLFFTLTEVILNVSGAFLTLGQSIILFVSSPLKFLKEKLFGVDEGQQAATASAEGLANKTGEMAIAAQKAATAQLQVQQRIELLTEKLKPLRQEWDAQVTAVRSSIESYKGLITQSGVTAGQVVKDLHNQVANFRTYAKDVKRLIKEGVSPAAIQELSQKGPQYVHALATGTGTELERYKRFWREKQAEVRGGFAKSMELQLADLAKKIKAMQKEINKLTGKKVTVTAEGVFKLPPGISVHDIVGGKAAGGPIDGPGPKGRDSVLMYGAPGEHMLTAAEVDRAGGHSAIYALRAAIRSGWRVPGYASGGAVEDARGRRTAGRSVTLGLEEGVAAFDRLLSRVAVALGRRVKDALSFAPSGALSGARFGGAAMSYIANFMRDAGVAFKVISGFRPGAVTRGTGRQSLHALGRALDLVGAGKTSMLDIWAAATRIPFKKEVIFSPAPFQVYGSGKHPGPPTNPKTRADHYNHVHVGLFDRGGFLMPGLTVAHNRTGKPEMVTPAGRDAAGRLSFGGQGTHIENLIVQPLSGQFRLRDVMTELRLQGVH